MDEAVLTERVQYIEDLLKTDAESAHALFVWFLSQPRARGKAFTPYNQRLVVLAQSIVHVRGIANIGPEFRDSYLAAGTKLATNLGWTE